MYNVWGGIIFRLQARALRQRTHSVTFLENAVASFPSPPVDGARGASPLQLATEEREKWKEVKGRRWSLRKCVNVARVFRSHRVLR